MKKIVIIMIMLLICTTISGCWDYREVNSLAILSAIGIDKADDPDKILLTAQIINSANISTPGGGGSSDGEAYFNVSSEANTVFEAIRILTHKIDRKLYGSHMKALIISKEMAENGISPYIDLFVRDPEPRNDMYIIISEVKAADILNIKPQMEQINGNYIHKLLETQFSASESVAVTLQNFVTSIMNEKTSPVSSIIRIEKGKLDIGGAAVFKEKKYVGNLNERETRGLLWVLNKVDGGILVAKGFSEGDKISFETIKSSSKIEPVIKNDEIAIDIKIKDKSRVGEISGCIDLQSELRLESMKKRNATVIKNEVKAAIKKAKEYKTDIFGFGEEVHKKYPDKWYNIKDNWDILFSELKINIIVEADIKRSGMIVKCLKSE